MNFLKINVHMRKVFFLITFHTLSIACFAQRTNNSFDLMPSWHLSSLPLKQPILFPESSLQNNKAIGFNRAKLAWYLIDPSVFYRNTSSTPPASNTIPVNNHLVREIFTKEVYPDYQYPDGIPTYQTILNLAFFPNEKGCYNYDVDSSDYSSGIDSLGYLKSPEKRWGGIMKKLNSNIITAWNLKYLAFWIMDPFVYNTNSTGGNLYINIGNISEDVLPDGRKSYEGGLPSTSVVFNVDTTIWGRVSTLNSTNVFTDQTYQDTGLDGLNNNDEQSFFQDYLDSIAGLYGSNSHAYLTAKNDPSSDSYHHYRGSDYDARLLNIIERYKNYNGFDGNSISSSMSPESYPTAATTVPDNEDINYNNVLDTAENYFQFKVFLKPDSLMVGHDYIVDSVVANPANGDGTPVTWYKFLIPLNSSQREIIGNISDYDSVSFVRMFLKGFSDTLILRFFQLALVTTDLTINVNEIQNDIPEISVYPNPNKGMLFIDNKKECVKYLKIYDLMGQEVYLKQWLNMNHPVVDISSLNNGMYVLIIESNNNTHIEKLIIEK